MSKKALGFLMVAVMIVGFASSVAAKGNSYGNPYVTIVESQGPEIVTIITSTNWTFDFNADRVEFEFQTHLNDDMNTVIAQSKANVTGSLSVYADANNESSYSIYLGIWDANLSAYVNGTTYNLTVPESVSGPLAASEDDFPYDYDCIVNTAMNTENGYETQVAILQMFFSGAAAYQLTYVYRTPSETQEEVTLFNCTEYDESDTLIYSWLIDMANMEVENSNITINVEIWSSEFNQYYNMRSVTLTNVTIMELAEDASILPASPTVLLDWAGHYWWIWLVGGVMVILTFAWYLGEKYGDSRVKARSRS